MTNRNAVDEVDLFELFGKLWKEKWVIFSFILVSFSLAIGFALTAKPSYKVSVPYSINLYPLLNLQFCTTKDKPLECLEEGTYSLAQKQIDAGWQWTKKSTFVGSFSQPLSKQEYLQYFSALAASVTETIKNQAEREVLLIDDELLQFGQSAEHLAASKLNAKRLIKDIDYGVQAIEFDTPNIAPSAKLKLAVVLSILLGAMLGTIFVLIREQIQSRKMQTQSQV